MITRPAINPNPVKGHEDCDTCGGWGFFDPASTIGWFDRPALPAACPKRPDGTTTPILWITLGGVAAVFGLAFAGFQGLAFLVGLLLIVALVFTISGPNDPSGDQTVTATSFDLDWSVLQDVAAERRRQEAKWGQQNHPNGTGEAWESEHGRGVGESAGLADAARDRCEHAAGRNECTFALILEEEVAEAMAEDDASRLRVELVQVAAVAVAWVEAIDRRAEQ